MPKAIDIKGNKYGRLTVIEKSENIGRYTAWKCVCDCGNIVIAKTNSLKVGYKKSCGCLSDETKERFKNIHSDIIKDNEIIGKQYGRLTVVSYCGTDKQRSKLFKCKCECGNEITTRKSRIINGGVKSCGCLVTDVWSKMKYKHGYARKDKYNRLYGIYSHMIDRCHNSKNPSYKNYGERGIFVCDQWLENVDLFMKWAMENGYEDNLSIDRIDNNKGYSPDNCRWVGRTEQANNKRNNIILKYNGKTKTLPEWSREIEMPQKTLRSRYYMGWSDKEIIETPINGKRVIK